MPSTVDVFVASTDAVGLALALVVAEQGGRCVVLDSARADASRARPTAFGEAVLSARSVTILDRLTDGAVVPTGVTVASTRVLPRGQAITEPSATGHVRTVDHPALHVEPRALLALLRQHVDASERIERVTGGYVSAIENARGTSGPVVVTRDEGPSLAASPRSSTWEATYVVGADGVDSPVREAMGLPFDGRDRRDSVLVVDVDTVLPLPAERRVVADPPGGGRTVELLPLPGNRWRLTWLFVGGLDRSVETTPTALSERLTATLGPHQPYAIAGASMHVVRSRVAPRFADGRVFLAGSAAHQAGPYGSRTLNDGLADADNLGWKLAYAARGVGSGPLLTSYDAERRPVATASVTIDRALLDFLAPVDRWSRLTRRLRVARAARRGGFGEVPGPSTYRASPVVQPGAGALAPELPVTPLDGGGARPLRELRGGPMIAVAIGATVTQAVSLAESVAAALPDGGPPVRIVAGAAAEATRDHDTAGAALGNILVVRPDGHFAWKVNGEDAPDEVAHRLAGVLRSAVGAVGARDPGEASSSSR